MHISSYPPPAAYGAFLHACAFVIAAVAAKEAGGHATSLFSSGFILRISSTLLTFIFASSIMRCRT